MFNLDNPSELLLYKPIDFTDKLAPEIRFGHIPHKDI